MLFRSPLERECHRQWPARGISRKVARAPRKPMNGRGLPSSAGGRRPRWRYRWRVIRTDVAGRAGMQRFRGRLAGRQGGFVLQGSRRHGLGLLDRARRLTAKPGTADICPLRNARYASDFTLSPDCVPGVFASWRETIDSPRERECHRQWPARGISRKVARAPRKPMNGRGLPSSA